MIPGAVGHNYSEDHQSAPRARRNRPLISRFRCSRKLGRIVGLDGLAKRLQRKKSSAETGLIRQQRVICRGWGTAPTNKSQEIMSRRKPQPNAAESSCPKANSASWVLSNTTESSRSPQFLVEHGSAREARDQ